VDYAEGYEEYEYVPLLPYVPNLSPSNMILAAFFTMGPLLITKDVPKLWDDKHPLKPDTWLSMQEEQAATETVPPIKLPIAGGKGMWNWLQPYSVPQSQLHPTPTPAPAPVPPAPAPAPASNPGPGSNPGPASNPQPPTTNPSAPSTNTTNTTNPTANPDQPVKVLDPNDPTNETHYNALEVGQEDGRMRMDPGPYTFVEGFLQLARPLVKVPKVPAS
jgi:hypothetical protein